MRETPRPSPGLAQNVAANVRAEMARRRVSGATLARGLGRSQMWLSRRLNGEVAFALDELEAIAQALGVDVARLMAVAA